MVTATVETVARSAGSPNSPACLDGPEVVVADWAGESLLRFLTLDLQERAERSLEVQLEGSRPGQLTSLIAQASGEALAFSVRHGQDRSSQFKLWMLDRVRGGVEELAA